MRSRIRPAAYCRQSAGGFRGGHWLEPLHKSALTCLVASRIAFLSTFICMSSSGAASRPPLVMSLVLAMALLTLSSILAVLSGQWRCGRWRVGRRRKSNR